MLKLRKMLKRNRKGFTLIELIVVIAILGILALIAIPRFQSVTENAQVRAFEANHRIAASAVQMSIAENNGSLPAGTATFTEYIDGGIAALQGDPVTGAAYVWNGTTLQSTATIGGTAYTETYTP